MATNKSKPKSRGSKIEPQEDAKGLIRHAFEFLRENVAKLSEDIAAFNRQRQEIQEKLNRGPRRTDGRIV